MLQKTIVAVSLAQKDGTRSFTATIQTELTPQYQAALQHRGPGAAARMKYSNQSYLEQNGQVAFNAINIHIKDLLRTSFADVKHHIRKQLQEITTLLRLALIDDVNLPPDHKEAKESILKLTGENVPEFAMRRIDINDRRRALGS
ncbi:hypothetical protein C8R43DRAFT_998403 [Mycena crocata]|nr:hypothetical protein C8R43DRAFT_998403 [Mycena crocata]